MSATPYHHSCAQLGVCQDRQAGCGACPHDEAAPDALVWNQPQWQWAPEPEPRPDPEPVRAPLPELKPAHGVDLWGLGIVLLLFVSAMSMFFLAGLVWGRWGGAIAAAWAALLPGA